MFGDPFRTSWNCGIKINVLYLTQRGEKIKVTTQKDYKSKTSSFFLFLFIPYYCLLIYLSKKPFRNTVKTNSFILTSTFLIFHYLFFNQYSDSILTTDETAWD